MNKVKIETFNTFIDAAKRYAILNFKNDYNYMMLMEALHSAKFYVNKCKENPDGQ